MKKQPLSYINLPIYSVAYPLTKIAHYSNKILFSGGGGHGISNQILIFEDGNMSKQVVSIETQDDIIENMTVNSNWLACSANADLIIWRISDAGKKLEKVLRWRSDTLLKNSTLNAVCWRPNQDVLAAGGDDATVRVFSLTLKAKQLGQELVYENRDHTGCLKHIDMDEHSPIVCSVENKKIVLSNYESKSVLRRIYSFNLEPRGCELLSAYFIENGKQLIIVNYQLKGSCFIVRTQNDMTKFVSRRSITDQSCLSAKSNNYIAVASGNGTVQLHQIETLKKVGVSRRHDMVIKGICFIGDDRVATGTPQCSYHIQKVTRERNYITAILMAMCLFLLFFKIEGEL